MNVHVLAHLLDESKRLESRVLDMREGFRGTATFEYTGSYKAQNDIPQGYNEWDQRTCPGLMGFTECTHRHPQPAYLNQWDRHDRQGKGSVVLGFGDDCLIRLFLLARYFGIGPEFAWEQGPQSNWTISLTS
jgi:hypothetical protein